MFDKNANLKAPNSKGFLGEKFIFFTFLGITLASQIFHIKAFRTQPDWWTQG